jgi:hypothetical protein
MDSHAKEHEILRRSSFPPLSCAFQSKHLTSGMLKIKNKYINAKYISWKGLLISFMFFSMLWVLSYPSIYDEIQHPTGNRRGTFGIISRHILFFMDKHLGKYGVFASIFLIACFFLFLSFNWKETLRRDV